MNRLNSNIIRSMYRLAGLFMLIFFVTINLQAQSARLWEKTYGMRSTEEIQAIATKPNGDHLMGGYVQSSGNTFQFYLIRTDVDGDLIYEKDFGEMTPEFSYDLAATDEGVIMVGEKRPALAEPGDILVMRINDKGEVLRSMSFGGAGRDVARAVVVTSDGGFAIVGETENANGDSDMFLLKLNANGDSLWMRTFDNNGGSDRASDLVEKADNSGFVIVGKSGNIGADMFLVETDTDGNELNRKITTRQGNLDPKAIVNAPTGYLVAGTFTEFSARGFISKIEFDLTGTIYPFGNGDEQGLRDIITTADGKFVAGGYVVEQNAVTVKSFLVEIGGEDENSLRNPTVKNFGNSEESREIYGLAEAGNKKGIVAAGQIFDFIVPNAWFLRVENGLRIPEKFIEGNVFFDTGNCQFELGEKPLTNWIVTCEGNNETLFATTDKNGNYFFRVDTGRFTVNLKVDNETWNPCFNGNVIPIDETVDTVELNFPVQAEHQCAYMEIDASAPKLEICKATDFQIFFCNKGTVDAQNAKVEVILDKHLTINSTTLPITQQTDSLVIFDLGEVKAGDCGRFTITATLDCTEPVLRQTHYFSARITPDSICIPTDLQWDGSSIEVSAACANDSVRFIVKNVGDDMTQARSALIVEDAILIRAYPVDLDNGQDTALVFPADGKTYRIVTEQSEYHPGKSIPSVALEGCVQTPGDSFSTGFVTDIEEDEKNPFVSIEPMENEPTTDFTFLRGYPNGVLDSLITSQTDLEYHFRFENRGNDTIKRVVIRDTLSQNLDITSIRYGTSSHPYSFRVYETGVVKFIFDDINLVPITNVNPAASRGFVKFKISQKPNNPAGTVIDNSASINKDFDAPEIPNSTRHVIGGDSLTNLIKVVSDTHEPFLPGVNVNIFPNPAVSHVTFEILGVKFKEYSVEIFDLSGKIISRKIQSQNRFTLNRGSLKAGIQFYRVTADGNLLDTGKIIVH